ncbi:TIGR03087 family PEP-CTERM/XrtA system glycosyltransferase [uncultured Novosphingobium sp.]|uniref:TIGR03087 family PEP-CTERM/XrtA system glycosyltransferase n=1 Tax=uncultured Novosphingobium sp. TaxID=292277 RepID=UPI0025845272|nr:TIGR03087 family PEP-CTERM/XrtA system glycosyltransferase [uncultured Novosphingobium sp.]
MSEILFIAHRIPFPPDRGDKIRSHHILKHLAARAPVHVATFADDALDFAAEPELAAMAASHYLVRRSKPLPLAAAEAMVTGQPISLTAFRSGTLARYVCKILATRPISTIYVFSGQMGQYVPENFRGRLIADFVDVDSAKFQAYAARDGGVKGWAQQREARLLQAEEGRFAAQADTSLLISDAEAALFRARLPAPYPLAAGVDVRTLGNGIDSDTFDPAQVEAEPQLARFTGPRLIFTGQMDYAPNIDACLRAAQRLLPRILAVHPDASLHIVGRNPAPALMALSGRHGVHVWGRVPDVRPWLAGCDLALVPLEIARGVQNKVLEAMAMALPVVLSPEAATGIPAQDGTEWLQGADDDALVAACLKLLENRNAAAAMGEAARRFVVEKASWPAALAPLDSLLGVAAGNARDAA